MSRRGLEEGGLEGDGYRAEDQGEALRRVGWRETGTGQRAKERP